MAESVTTQHIEANENGHNENTLAHTEQKQDVFSQLLNENIGDHHSLSFFGYGHLDLPKIFIDNGFHFYWNGHQMEEAGLFTEQHHSYVRASDHEAPVLDLSITSFVFFEFLAAILLFVVFKFVSGKYKKNPDRAPSGFQNLIEVVFTYVRDEIVRPNLPTEKLTNKLLPYFISLFFFILALNLFGLIPGGHSATSNIAVTAGLAIIAFFVIQITAIKESGVGAWFHHLLGGAPWWLFPIMVPIEIISMFVKPFALTVRLFANMTAGHVVILSLIGLIFFFKTIFVSPVSVGFALFIYTLELLVAFIQAYVFTILTAVFVGLAVGDHAHEHAESH